MRKAIEELADKAKAEIVEILSAPVIDPAAPAGYCRPAFVEAETRRRHAAARAVIDRLLSTIERKYGQVPAGRARDHLAPVLAELEGLTLH